MNSTLPTTAAAWRVAREEGFIITLPSGNTARLRPVPLDVLITSGKLPDMLSPIAAKTLWVEEDVASVAETPELAKGFAELVNFIVPVAFMEPEVITDGEPEDGQIHIEDVDFGDKVAVFNLVTSGAATLREFRKQQTRNVDTLPDGKSNGQPTKRTRKPKRPVDGATA